MSASTPYSTPTTTTARSSECTTATPGRHGHVNDVDACNAYYNFDPKFVPAVAVAVIFGLFTLAHVILAFVHRKRYALVLITGACWETLAFTLHSLGALDQQNIGYAIGHAVLYLLAPLWINAFVYMTVARMIHFLIPEQKIWVIKSTVLSKLFVWADVVTFLVQAVGGSMASPGSSPQVQKTGLTVYMVGIGVQEACILAFVGLMALFHRRMMRSYRHGPLTGGVEAGAAGDAPWSRLWKRTLLALYGVLGLIMVRIIYRIAEFAGGVTPSNPVPFHEIYSYMLDAFPMMLALLLLVIWHPGRLLQGPGSTFMDVRRARTQAKMVKKNIKAARRQQKRTG